MERFFPAVLVLAAVWFGGSSPSWAGTLPNELSDLQLWLRADAGVTESGGDVSLWADQSSNGRDAVAAVGTEPTLVAAVPSLNNQPALRFDGTVDLMTVASRILPDGARDMTIFSVAQSNETNDYSIVGIRTGSSNPLIQLDQDSTGKARFIVRDATNSATLNSVVPKATGAYGIYSGRLSTTAGVSSATVGFNGVMGNTATGTFTTNTATGTQQIGGVAGGYWNGDIAEVIIYDRALDEAEMTAVGQYLSDKYLLNWLAEVPTDGLALWLRADAGLTVDGDGRVSAWADQSVNSRNAGSSGENRPLYVESVEEVNGRPALRFAENDALGISSRILPADCQEFTMIAVAKSNKDDNASILGFRQTGTSFIQLDQQGSSIPDHLGTARFIVRDDTGATANALGDEVHTGQYGIYAGMLTRDDLTGISTAGVYFNGELEGTATATFDAVDPNFGASTQRIGSTMGSLFWDGDIAEILIFDRALTPEEMAGITDYLDSKYNLTPVPEPTTPVLALLGGLVSLLMIRRRRG